MGLFNKKSNPAPTAGKQKYTQIDAAAAKAMMEQNPGCIIIDVRSRSEYSEQHIPGAVSIPLDALSSSLGQLPDKNQTLLLYCRSGSRSRQGSEQLAALGYAHVYCFGGITSWPYETE